MHQLTGKALVAPKHAPFSSCRRVAARVQPNVVLQSNSVRGTALNSGSGKLGEIQVIVDSSLLGPSVSTGASVVKPAGAPPAPKVQDWDSITLKSEAGQDYQKLKAHLQAGEFREADDETRALLINLAGAEAVKRGWVYWTEVKFIPAVDLQTINNLWKVASNGKFGYSVQREVWLQNKKRWAPFFKQIDWTIGENNAYRKWPAEFKYDAAAAKGHLPLTNALRGTQLFEAIMEHPAWQNQKS